MYKLPYDGLREAARIEARSCQQPQQFPGMSNAQLTARYYELRSTLDTETDHETRRATRRAMIRIQDEHLARVGYIIC